MRAAGYLLVTLGFLAAAYAAVERVESVSWSFYLGALAVGVVGVVLARTAMHRTAHHGEVLTTNIRSIGESLATLVREAARLDDGKAEIDVYDLRHRIDATFADPLTAFVSARESIAHSFGLQAYAEVMNHFAAAERYLLRVWSASTDGYIDEAHTYLAKSREQFAQAQAVFEGLGPTAPA